MLVEVYRALQPGISIFEMNESIYQVSLQLNQNNETTPTRIVNLDLESCSCKRIFAYEYPCWHILTVLFKTGKEILAILPDLVGPRWKSEYTILNDVSEFEFNGSLSQIFERNRLEGRDKAGKESKLRKKPGPGATTSAEKPSLKKTKKTKSSTTTERRETLPVWEKQEKIQFIAWKGNSCRFDVFLAEALCYENETQAFSASLTNSDSEDMRFLLDCIVHLNASQFFLTQQAFIKYCEEKNFISEKAATMGCIIELFEKFYSEKNIKEFQCQI